MNIEQYIVGGMGVCCYLVSCEETGEAAVIDPGAEHERILAGIEEKGLKLKYIIATHGHPDHVHCVQALKDATNAEVIIHKAEGPFFEEPEIKGYFSHLEMNFCPEADIKVADGDVINIGKETFTVLHTPGHTPGGICLLTEGNVFTGDTLFVGACGRTDFPGGKHADLMDAIKTKLVPLADDIVVWPGHGYGGERSSIGFEKRTNPYM
ncbi:MAG: MBL fold metallo-hydrolase [Desulfotalea sp.]